ncbi:Serine/threonine-protein kinase PRP4 homolog (PRP4 pre-mRNA-processing factor 4 homolog) [Durusdinium trenchii]|uniref:Serine/threonine-protein kinase PRP4 homolog (PRP4 pre-mRNA-processing factor 4 homolog) n=1 Tax=Durusdinium trenchii TaxID=1381693 RepID=A0ABP0MB64_9DINO
MSSREPKSGRHRSPDDDRKRRREKKEKEKDREKDRGDRGRRDKDRGDRDRGDRDRGDRDRGDRDRGDRDRGDREERRLRRSDRSRSRSPPAPSPPKVVKSTNWKEEQNEGEDLRDHSDDEETAARKLEESRKRRAAMITQAKEEKEKKEQEEKDKDISGENEKAKEEPSANDVSEMKIEKDEKGENGEEDETQEKEPEVKDGGGDMFDLNLDAKELKAGQKRTQNIATTGASTEDWDDEEGYYIAQVGELLESRYLVQDTVSGRGVFSNVVKAKDTKTEGEPLVALKIIRSNDMMKKAAEKEMEILQMLNNADKANKRHIVRLIETFYYRKHIFMVFECMAEDLRGALKKYTKNRGMSIMAVKGYTKQLLIGVRHMHKFNIIHADLKPDNILISQDNSIVKLCDFGTAVEQKDIGVSPYLMSRFYRPAEVILGCEYGVPVDVWALACTLYEIFTGKTLLQGKTNNDMLKRIMDLKGKIPKNVIKKGAVWKNHFDENLDFKFIDKDSMTGEEITRIITDNNCKRELKEFLLDRVGPEKQKSQEREDQQYVKKTVHFADLLDKMLALDPEKRLTAEDALKHHFVEDPKAQKAAAGAAAGKRA